VTALAVEDLALATMMVVPSAATPSLEVVGRARGMSRQAGARKRIKAAQARMEAQAAAGGVINPGGPETESAGATNSSPPARCATRSASSTRSPLS